MSDIAADHGRATELSDDGLIARARAGDMDAQDALIRRYADDVYRLTLRLLGDSDVAQDAAQDTFVNALRGLDKFRGDSSFKTWLLRIALNTSNTIGRRRTRRREVTLDAASTQPAPGTDVGEKLAVQREGERLGALLQHLPTKQRLAVTLRIQNGLSYAEIGEAIDCSEGSARVNYHLGIKRLKELAGL